MKTTTSTKLRYAKAPRFPVLGPILREWLQIIDLYLQHAEPGDVPWWDAERANVSILAGAVWRSGGVALEEFADIQGTSCKGRVDLYFTSGADAFCLEAKSIWSQCGKHAADPERRIHEELEDAATQVKTRADGSGQKLAAVFAVPCIPVSQNSYLDDLIRAWLKCVATVKCDAAAWTFPKNARTSAIADGKYHPGVAVFLKRVR